MVGECGAPGKDEKCVQNFGWNTFLRVKRPGREADHSPLSSAEVENAWRNTSTPPI